MVSHPETSSDSPIGSDQESGRDMKCLILIYVLYKSENIVTLVTIWYIVGFIVSMYYEYRLWAQVVVLLM